jgi:hypothetical protein
MTRSTPEGAIRGRRRLLAALRSLGPSALAAVTLALVLGGNGLASAASGGNFILGRANTETSTARLSDSNGTPLSLSAPHGHAPLSVNRSAMVKNLNAEYTGGLSAAQLQATGGDGFTSPGTGTGINRNGQIVTGTGPLPAGTYYVTATAMVNVSQGDGGALCYIIKNSNANISYGSGEIAQEGYVTLAATTAISAASGDILQEVCRSGGLLSASYVYNAGITAIRILSSSGTPPAAGRPIGLTPPVRRSLRGLGPWRCRRP